jgi:septal ring factor EnvC (AmiA/AmiB activator)
VLRLAFFLVYLAAGAAWGASQEEILKALRGRIEKLDRELARTESSQKEARDALRDSERSISAANRSLTLRAAEARQVRSAAARLATQRAAVNEKVLQREKAIERMLAAWAAAGAPDALRVALSGDDPSDLGRRLHYLGSISRAASALLAEQRAALAELERLAGEAKGRAERLQEIERASRADRDRLLAERRARSRVLRELSADIRSNRKEIRVLRADEARLARLVEALGRSASTSASEPFSALRGKLRFPVRGELTQRFGAPRGAAGTEAKGVFLRAPEGQPVRAIARGQVVYADWMRGFGNLLIVDHGENYLSIYANNESLLKELGDAVASGETIATTGSSGGNEETGLYFEMRHLGRAFDPLRWVKLK